MAGINSKKGLALQASLLLIYVQLAYTAVCINGMRHRSSRSRFCFCWCAPGGAGVPLLVQLVVQLVRLTAAAAVTGPSLITPTLVPS
jgi:hypothetical protein